MRFITAYIIFLFCSSVAYCQNQTFSFNHLTVNDGLSVGVNNCIYKDSKGYIWVSSFDGLNKYDGLEVEVFKDNFKDSNSIKGTLFLNILEDKNSNLWIGSNEGLNFYDRKHNQFKCYFNKLNQSTNQTYSPFYIDNTGNVWLQSGQNILLFNPVTKQFKNLYTFTTYGNLIIKFLPQTQLQTLGKIFVAVRGTSLMFTADANQSVLNFASLPVFSQANNLSINAYTIIDNQFWIGTNNGLYKYEKNRIDHVELVVDGTIQPNVTVVYADAKKNICIGTQKDGLFYFSDSNTTKPKQYVHSMYNPYSLSGNQVQYIYTDDINNLWVSIWGKGLDYVNLNKFRFEHYLTEQEANKANVANFIRSIVEVNTNEFWCGTQLNGILVLNGDKKIIGTINKNIPPSIEHLYKDSKQNIWIATQQGLYLHNANTKQITKVTGFEKYTAAAQQFNYTTELSSGIILTSTNAGVFLIEHKNNLFKIVQANGVSNFDVYATSFQSKNGDIYLSKAFKGFGIYTLQNDSLVLKKDFYNQSTVKCYAEQNDSILWIGTTKGLLKFNKNNLSIIKTYNSFDGLPNQYIYSVLFNNNELWLTSNSGISKFDIGKNEFKNFTISDGLQSNEFNTYSFCKTSTGEFLFGGVNGINAFYPNKIKKYLVTPNILLQRFYINDTLTNTFYNPEEIGAIELPYKQNTLSFQFAVLDYSNANNCKILYKLQGYDRDWISIKNKSLIRYANLPSGNYTLQVKAVNAEGFINEKMITIAIKIKTPWNKTWWFILLVIAAIAGLVWYIIRSYYLRKLEKQKAILEKQHAVEQERNRIATDMHDDLGSGLTKITYLSQMALNKQNTTEDLQNIKKTSTELVENMSEIIWAMKEENNSLEDLVYYIKNYALEYCADNKLNCTIHLPEKLYPRVVAGQNRRNIYLAIKETLHNIVKHAQAKNVVLTASFTNQWVLSIKDDGIGFNPSTQEKHTGGNGLKNIYKRIEAVRGTVEIKNNNGTEFIFYIPL